jgi:hypothetical protein
MKTAALALSMLVAPSMELEQPFHVTTCKSWTNFINPHNPTEVYDGDCEVDCQARVEIMKHFTFETCRHKLHLTEEGTVRQMLPREYKRGLLPEARQSVFQDNQGNWQFWALERCTEEQKEKYY